MVTVSRSVQIALVSTAVLFIGLVVKSSIPLVLDFSVYQAPLIWSSLASWLRPPYLYVIINFIIITIAASSRFHQDKTNEQQPDEPVPQVLTKAHSGDFDEELKVSTAEIPFGGVESTVEEKEVIVSSVDNVFEDKSSSVVVGEDVDEDEFVISKSTWMPPPKRTVSLESLTEILSSAEKPLVSARFGHRKPLRPSPEGGRALRVSKPKRHETLENTWKAITDGRAMPLTRHLKKCDTWENHSRQENVSPVDPTLVKKSETFKDRTNYQSPPESSTPPSGRLRKEPSLSQDELNRRVEAFIKKFNEEMRLQRQESLNQYKEMVSGGVY